MVSCGNYDYIEIVCLYKYPISLTLKSGQVVSGTAVDTQLNDNREECVKLEIDQSFQLVNLDQISELTVTVENPHIQSVSFE